MLAKMVLDNRHFSAPVIATSASITYKMEFWKRLSLYPEAGEVFIHHQQPQPTTLGQATPATLNSVEYHFDNTTIFLWPRCSLDLVKI